MDKREREGVIAEADKWEALVADLQRQLRQAEEERDRAVGELVAEVGEGYKWDEKYGYALNACSILETRAEKAEALADQVIGEARKARKWVGKPEDWAYALGVVDLYEGVVGYLNAIGNMLTPAEAQARQEDSDD